MPGAGCWVLGAGLGPSSPPRAVAADMEEDTRPGPASQGSGGDSRPGAQEPVIISGRDRGGLSCKFPGAATTGRQGRLRRHPTLGHDVRLTPRPNSGKKKKKAIPLGRGFQKPWSGSWSALGWLNLGEQFRLFRGKSGLWTPQAQAVIIISLNWAFVKL